MITQEPFHKVSNLQVVKELETMARHKPFPSYFYLETDSYRAAIIICKSVTPQNQHKNTTKKHYVPIRIQETFLAEAATKYLLISFLFKFPLKSIGDSTLAAIYMLTAEDNRCPCQENTCLTMYSGRSSTTFKP